MIIVTDGVEIEVRRSNGKLMKLKVRSIDAGVTLTVPRGVTDKQARQFIQKHLEWLKRTRGNIKGKTEQGKALFFGKQYEVRPGSAGFDGQAVYLPAPADRAEGEKELLRVYRAALAEYIDRRLPQLELVVGRRCRGYSIRRMRARWGSCDTYTGKLTFNLWLAKKPPAAIDYVIVHELTHLFYPDHGKDFKAKLMRIMPDWKDRKKLLNGE